MDDAQLDKLEALAKAADGDDSWLYYTRYQEALIPSVVLALISQARVAPPESATGTTGAPELSDAGIVEVLASMGIDSEPSKFGFKELQVRTTVPTIRKVVERYLAAPASAQPTDLERDYQADYQYLLGLRAGWNLSQQRDVEGFNAALVARQACLDDAKRDLRGSAQPDRGAAKAPTAQAVPMEAIGKILAEAMARASANGANSVSMPDEYVAIAHFVAYPEKYATAPANQPEASPASQPVAPTDAVLVPRTITEDMHVAAVRVINRATGNADWPPMVWDAMLAAAPVAAVAPSDAKPNPTSEVFSYAAELVRKELEPAVQLISNPSAATGKAAAANAGGRIAAYKPGSWFDASTLDEMQAFYLSRLPAIREAAKEHGYAIGLHGSQRRDFDLMAMQWREDASDKDTLAHAIAMAACGITRLGGYVWERKPSGRFAVSMPICWTDYANPDFDKPSIGHIDLSVIEFPATSAADAKDAALTQAARDVLAERRRQVEQEGWTPKHDDKYSNCELARAAATYALCSHIEQLKLCGEQVWPWHPDWWKRTTYRRDLIKAGALILAEIERIDRAAMAAAPSSEKGGAV